MSDPRITKEADDFVMEDPEATLERMHIEAYLRAKGHTSQSLRELPEHEARQLMAEASAYASAKLAEVETRAQLVHELHGTAPSL